VHSKPQLVRGVAPGLSARGSARWAAGVGRWLGTACRFNLEGVPRLRSRQLPSWAGFTSGAGIIGASPDGTRIAYDAAQGAEGTVQVSDLFSTQTRALAVGYGWQAAIHWTPAGVTVGRFAIQRKAAFLVSQASNGQIISQQTYRLALPDGAAEGNVLPSWSPDGSRLTFSALGPHGRHLYVMNADGTNVQELNTGTSGGGVVQPAWSPDGTRIAYVDWNGSAGSQVHLFVIDPDGSHRTDLGTIGDGVEGKTIGAGIAWSPNSQSIAFLGKNLTTRGWALYVKDLGGATRRMPIKDLSGFTIAWADES
jgi:dipeptidyl aminopeptidase/acylaminoacyl peptidase